RRYASAAALAEDLRCFLADQPIHARRSSMGVRAWRWCRRKPAAAGLLAVSVAAVLGLLTVSLSYNARLSAALNDRQAESERAETNADNARQAKEWALANLLKAHEAVDRQLTHAGHTRLRNVPYLENARRGLLEDAAKMYEDFLRESPEDPAVRAELGRVYRKLGDVRHLLGANS